VLRPSSGPVLRKVLPTRRLECANVYTRQQLTSGMMIQCSGLFDQ
jgi:hypothetical protein